MIGLPPTAVGQTFSCIATSGGIEVEFPTEFFNKARLPKSKQPKNAADAAESGERLEG